MNNSLIYLACPYSHPDPAVRQARFRIANKAAARLMADEFFVFSPISMSHSIAEDAGVPGTWDFWRGFDTAMIARCQRFIVVAIDGLNESVGVRAEIVIARDLGLAIEYAIPLTKAKSYFALVDEGDFEAVNAFNWTVSLKRSQVYAHRKLRKNEEGLVRNQYLHQFLMPGEEEIDHQNGKGWDNRRQNLRSVTHQQNLHGFQTKRRNTSSRFRGVTWSKNEGKWQSQMGLNGKTLYLGLFDSEEDAARARDATARKHFGENAHLNFP